MWRERGSGVDYNGAFILAVVMTTTEVTTEIEGVTINGVVGVVTLVGVAMADMEVEVMTEMSGKPCDKHCPDASASVRC